MCSISPRSPTTAPPSISENTTVTGGSNAYPNPEPAYKKTATGPQISPTCFQTPPTHMLPTQRTTATQRPNHHSHIHHHRPYAHSQRGHPHQRHPHPHQQHHPHRLPRRVVAETHAPTTGTCTRQTNTDAQNLASLTPGIIYTYTAYSAANCHPGDQITTAHSPPSAVRSFPARSPTTAPPSTSPATTATGGSNAPPPPPEPAHTKPPSALKTSPR